MTTESGVLSPEQEAKKEAWIKALSGFIVEANRETYAANKGWVKPEEVERRDHEEMAYLSGDFELRDSFSGTFRAPGATYILYKGKVSWVMNYGGTGQEPGKYQQTNGTTDFLKSALKLITIDLPYRGPREYVEGNKRYEMEVEGTPENFSGKEKITEDGELTFSQFFHGGIVIDNDLEGEPVYPWDR